MKRDFGSSATEEIMRLASGFTDPLARATRGDSVIEKAMREANEFASMTKRAISGLSASEEAFRIASGGLSPTDKIASGSVVDKAMAEATATHQRLMDGAAGKTGTLADAIDNLKGFRGIDDSLLSGVKDRLGSYDSATSALEKELAKTKQFDPLGFREIERFNPPPLPEMPPIPRNPIHKTNELLDEMVGGIEEQRGLIEASAEAQKQETELLAKLVEAFTASQVASDHAARRSQTLAWIGIGVAIATSVITIVLQALKII